MHKLVIIVLVLIILFLLMRPSESIDCFTNSNPMTVYYFYMENCQYCVAFQQEWNKFKQSCAAKGIITKEIKNCNDQNLCNKYNITGFPTIIINYKGSDYIYKNNRTAQDLLTFCVQLNTK